MSEHFAGFGDPSGEYWLGNEAVYLLTSQASYSLRIELKDWEGNHPYSQYERFQLGSEKQHYSKKSPSGDVPIPLVISRDSGLLLSLLMELLINPIGVFPKKDERTFRDCAEAYKAGLNVSGVYTVRISNATEPTKGYSGTPGQQSSLVIQGTSFSTRDSDNDNCLCKCALMLTGGWWFDACGLSNLNGMYYPAGHNIRKLNGIKWHHFRGPSYSLRATTMMIRPSDF
ncbi:Angiopoietin-4 [Acipenser ruthenus]|uniref:Angiopoietin-4 n=1 Tax=Acipenser ruthenus TaxID=7906 RepID=A0A444V5K9_ACIRT|nr:Angiopoietin-4 [Acipenser ruthenus]